MTHTTLLASEEPQADQQAAVPVTLTALDLESLFKQHHHHLLRFVQRYVRNQEDAEDVVQNTFLEALRCANQFSGLSKPSTWLFGIALNLARNQVRRKCADLCDALDESAIENIVDLQSDPAAQVELRQVAGKVEECLSSLSPDIRATFEAVFDQESTYEEAAEQLNIPVGTVRSRVSRVRSTVRQHCGYDA
jgi:RNA polymerase sigma-70 factor (ECF subfamily)